MRRGRLSPGTCGERPLYAAPCAGSRDYSRRLGSVFPPEPPPTLAPYFAVEDFNYRLKHWLQAESSRTVGLGDLTSRPVMIGKTFCWLAAETTRAGVEAYLQMTSPDCVYSVVRSSEGVVRRVVPGRHPERIPGFYLYTKKGYDFSQVISPVTAPLELWAVCMLILDAVAELHQRGHQRLRIYPNISGSGMHWRTRIVDVDTSRLSEWGWPEWDEASFAYSTGQVFEVGGMLVDTTTTPGDVAHRILAAFPAAQEAGRGRDWAYAGWYAEVLGSARTHHNLPVGDELITIGGARCWRFVPMAENSIEEPPAPPVQARR